MRRLAISLSCCAWAVTAVAAAVAQGAERPGSLFEPGAKPAPAQPLPTLDARTPPSPGDTEPAEPIPSTGAAIPGAPIAPTATPPADPPPQPKATAPSATEQAQTLKLLREAFEKEYSSTAPAARGVLALRLLKEADATRQGSASHYVMLREGLEAALAAGDAGLCVTAIASLERSFIIEADAAAEDAVMRLLSKPSADASLLPWAADVAERAIAQERSDAARRILALALPRASKDAPSAARLRAVEQSIHDFDKLKPFLARLKTTPLDPAANLAVGRYQIIRRSDWKTGLSQLAKGSDAKLRDLAAKDLTGSEIPSAQFELASAWWAMGRDDAVFRAACEERAAYWYAKAQPALSDLQKVLAEKRIHDVAERAAKPRAGSGPTAAREPANLISVLSLPRDSVKGNWQTDPNQLSAPAEMALLRLPYTPPAEYDLSLTFIPAQGFASIRLLLSGNGHEFSYLVGAKYSGLDLVKRVPAHSNKTKLIMSAEFPAGKPRMVLVKVRRGGVAVYLDGVTLIEQATDFGDLSQAPHWSIGTNAVGIASSDGKFSVTAARITDITGKGTPLYTSPPATKLPSPASALLAGGTKPVMPPGTKSTPAKSMDLEDLAKLPGLKLLPQWEGARARTTLESRRVTDSLVFTKAGSPYGVSGFLLVEKGAKVSAEPGAVILFAPDVKVENQGTITFGSEGEWIVLVSSQKEKKWKGIDSAGKISMRRCILVGAQTGIETHHSRDGLVATQCIFAQNGIAVSFGNNASGKVDHSLFWSNGIGLFGHGDSGKAVFSRCLLLGNERGVSANFYGGIEGVSSTFYANGSAIECPDRGDFVRVRLCNVLASTQQAALSKGGKIHAAGNYWGAGDVPQIPNADSSGALTARVPEAMPMLPLCPFVQLK